MIREKLLVDVLKSSAKVQEKLSEKLGKKNSMEVQEILLGS